MVDNRSTDGTATGRVVRARRPRVRLVAAPRAERPELRPQRRVRRRGRRRDRGVRRRRHRRSGLGPRDGRRAAGAPVRDRPARGRSPQPAWLATTRRPARHDRSRPGSASSRSSPPATSASGATLDRDRRLRRGLHARRRTTTSRCGSGCTASTCRFDPARRRALPVPVAPPRSGTRARLRASRPLLFRRVRDAGLDTTVTRRGVAVVGVARRAPRRPAHRPKAARAGSGSRGTGSVSCGAASATARCSCEVLLVLAVPPARGARPRRGSVHAGDHLVVHTTPGPTIRSSRRSPGGRCGRRSPGSPRAEEGSRGGRLSALTYVQRARARRRAVRRGQLRRRSRGVPEPVHRRVRPLAASDRRLPLVCTVHDVVPHHSRVPAAVERRLLAGQYRHAGTLLVPHDVVRRRLVARVRRRPGAGRRHAPGHPGHAAAADAAGRPAATVLFFGTFRRNKGVDVLLDAIAAARRPTPGSCSRAAARRRGLVVDAAQRDPRIERRARLRDRRPQERAARDGADLMVLPYTSFASQSGCSRTRTRTDCRSSSPTSARSARRSARRRRGGSCRRPTPRRSRGDPDRAARRAGASGRERRRRAIAPPARRCSPARGSARSTSTRSGSRAEHRADSPGGDVGTAGEWLEAAGGRAQSGGHARARQRCVHEAELGELPRTRHDGRRCRPSAR